ncbi:MAG: TetR/AcrR family transcriptional regulator, partial [Syntrophobacteraceae bacterium]
MTENKALCDNERVHLKNTFIGGFSVSAASRRQLQKEETRKIIRETAYSLFEKEGYEETTMRSLAKAAGVGLGTIFSHFPDKSSLLAAAFLDDLDQIVEQAFSSLPDEGIIEQLEHIVREIYEFYAKRPNFSRTMISRLFFLQGPYGKDLENQLSNFLSKIESLFQKAKFNNEISNDIDTTLYIQAFGSFYFHALHYGLRDKVFD